VPDFFSILLEDANVKLGNVLSDVFGVSGQLMLEALFTPENDSFEILTQILMKCRRQPDPVR
jgi:hypothetical protein